MKIYRILLFCIPFLSPAVLLLGEPVTIWISSLRDKSYYEKMVERYRQTVDSTFQARVEALGFQELPDKLGVALRTGAELPDVVQLDEVFWAGYLADESPFLDLTERVTKSDIGSVLLKNKLKMFQYRERVYGLPQSVSAMLLFYRRDLFERFGVEASEMETWQGLREAGLRLAEQGQPLLAIDPSYFEIILRQRGSDLFSAEGDVLPDFEIAVSTLEWLGSLVKDGVGQEPDRGTVFDPVFFTGDIANEEVLAVVGAEWYGRDLLQQYAADTTGKWGVLPLPMWKDGSAEDSLRTSTFSGQGLFIMKDSAEIEKSWEFVHFVMTDYRANLDRYLGRNSLPAFLPMYSDPTLLNPSGFYGEDSLGKLVVELADEVPPIVADPRRGMAAFMIREGMLTAVANGYATADETLNKFRRRLIDGNFTFPE